LIGPFRGQWRTATGGGACRIADLSLSGCFISCLTPPDAGERAAIIIESDSETSQSVEGAVVSSEWGLGFSVRFERMTALEQAKLKALMVRLRDGRGTA
jgi:hypothetical protein